MYEPVDIVKGLSKEQALSVAVKVGLEDQKDSTAEMLLNMYKLFITKDASLIEINPYAEDTDGKCNYLPTLIEHNTYYFIYRFCTGCKIKI